MSEENKMQIFEDKKIRTAWNESEEEWYFSIVDVISVLTDSNEPRRYWSDLKRKLKAEGANQLYENIVQLKMQSPKDGKNYKTDVANYRATFENNSIYSVTKSRTFQNVACRSWSREN